MLPQPQKFPVPEEPQPAKKMERVMELALRLRRRAATVAIVLMAVCIGYYVVAGQNGLQSYEHKRHEAEHLQQQIEHLQQENGQLQQQVHALQSDPDAIEHEARERLHYARPGEVIYTLNNAPSAANGGSGAGQPAPPSPSR